MPNQVARNSSNKIPLKLLISPDFKTENYIDHVLIHIISRYKGSENCRY